ncbi:WavE lipopolysaccharide synthesis family protein [Agathobaculum sp. NTUH-O15-33]|uniref:WavE lipopolysaccharide synthesis family protein n=1 Tax=Agathobaculum sp. NTUH-O15-33 TaxID=3079302 RepID=UPI002958784B|nr:WavE lipopolysaccharide synthesis family protein [Agathobaculum sp. NTUH-O15-33]WNX85162.1 WavE lipopolysaccharide synthesis family protein [Agathobaculum sp. NTUH-O15-33]
MTINEIDTKDISIVIQGAVDRENTARSIASIRKNLPQAEIILSTWEGTDVSCLNSDIVVFSKDPYGFQDKFCSTFTNNTLRQLISTQNGIHKATRRYILKIRSDLIIKSCNFLKYFNRFTERDDRYKLFHHRLIFSSFFSKKFCSSDIADQPLPFHVSDWLAFGFSEDIRLLYSVELPKEPETAWYLNINKYRGVKADLLRGSHRYAPEQYIFYNACKRVFPEIVFDNYLDYNRSNIQWSENLIIQNCILLDPWQFRFVCGKKKAGSDRYNKWTKYPFTMPKSLRRGMYSHKVFINDYEKYCMNKTNAKKGELDDLLLKR